ncbi:hypothetical protein TWF694_003511 [Orbilia ellipsospora]|uniref:Uncharacterized protein n=1 Tax=Orbilia ellipsospora TaxID=2528407 RepID=A0AAV9WYF2_9PEZI
MARPKTAVGTVRPSSAISESISKSQRRAGREKRFSFTDTFDFLPARQPSSSHHHRNKPSTDTTDTLVFNHVGGKLRKQESTQNTRSRTNASRLRVKHTISASSTSNHHIHPQDSSLSSSTKPPSKLSFLKPPKLFSMGSLAVNPKKARSCGAIIRKIFSCTKGDAILVQETVSKLDIKPRSLIVGTGSDLKGILHLFGNESLRICHQLCRLPGDDIESINTLSDRIGSLGFNVKQFNAGDAPHTLLLPATIFQDGADEHEREMMAAFMREFVSMLPCGTDNISRKADPSDLVFRLLPSPIISPAARYLGAAFWLWLCAIDDQIEELEQSDFEQAIDNIKMVFNYEDGPVPDSRVTQTSMALRTLVEHTELKLAFSSDEVDEHTWRRSFLDAIMEILYAFEGERPLLQQFKKGDGEPVKLTDWMILRVVTISARPFMVLARASLGIQPILSSYGNALKSMSSGIPYRRNRSDSAQTYTPDLEWEDDISRLEVLAQCAMGLENDILGWEKDHAENNILNSVEILYQSHHNREAAMREMVLIHNYTVNQLCLLGDTILSKYTAENNLPLASPARTLFRRDSVKGPRSHLPFSKAVFSTHSVHTTDTFNDDKNIIQRIKGKVHKNELSKELALTKQAQYAIVLFGFVQGMAVWTSKAKRYAV